MVNGRLAPRPESLHVFSNQFRAITPSSCLYSILVLLYLYRAARRSAEEGRSGRVSFRPRIFSMYAQVVGNRRRPRAVRDHGRYCTRTRVEEYVSIHLYRVEDDDVPY